MPGFEHQHPRASDGKFTDKPVDEAAGGLSALGADDQAQAEVAELLTPYGLELQDVPLDADGVSLAEHWARLREQAGAPLPDSVTDVVEAHLGIEDYGRLRGEPRLVWLAPDEDGSDWRDAEWDGVEVQAGDARWDDPDAALAWRVHTRNGGGNRECWDDDHDEDGHDCLVTTIDALTSHPAHLHDVDDSFDQTYATFLFSVPKDSEGLRASVDSAEGRAKVARAQQTVEAVTSGKVGPWAAMPVNPRARAAAAAADAEISELTSAERAFGPSTYSRDFRPVASPTPEHVGDLDAILAYADGGPRAVAEGTKWVPRARWNSHGTVFLPSLVEAVDRARESRALAADAERVRATLDTTPEHVRRVLEKGLDSLDYRMAPKSAEDWSKRVAVDSGRARAAREETATRVQNLARAAELGVSVRTLRANATWPGEPGTAPVRRDAQEKGP
ncbi:hypothetical protein [Oerskovia enterophila]|uniref:Uncharacterized protein n=1 Tax=Oerskovia enterophila TaxID=43678 RepID=A0ABX2Y8M7_9CELL|nr:hypothetical protein [Oerskovia enterophila]OCI32840.1 hypothetical protein OERS_04320 [Oerskovia enterophila]